MKCSLLPSSFSTITPISVHVNGFEAEQVYQQLKAINETRFQLLLTTTVKSKTKQKMFGDLLRSPSPEKSSFSEDNIEAKENVTEDLSIPSQNVSRKKKKSVT